jgi:diadenosine tetraphosphate (Ap4A) HIT family hydrolase
MTTSIHRRVDALRAGDDPTFIARLASGWAVLGERQVLPGYCLLLPDPVVPTLNALQGAARQAFLGNLDPALHAHVIPRYHDEPAELRAAQPWAYDWDAAPAFDPDRHRDLRDRIHAALARVA